ncbi:MAG: hypothetical protein WCG55_03065 [bacterium]
MWLFHSLLQHTNGLDGRGQVVNQPTTAHVSASALAVSIAQTYPDANE